MYSTRRGSLAPLPPYPHTQKQQQHLGDLSTRSGSLDSTFSGYTTESTAGFRTPLLHDLHLPLPPLLSGSAKSSALAQHSEQRRLPSLSSTFPTSDMGIPTPEQRHDDMVDVFPGFVRSARKDPAHTPASNASNLQKYSTATDLYNLAAVANGLITRESSLTPSGSSKRPRSKTRTLRAENQHADTTNDAKRFKVSHTELATNGLASLPHVHQLGGKEMARPALAYNRPRAPTVSHRAHRSSADSIHSLLAGLESKREIDSRSSRGARSASVSAFAPPQQAGFTAAATCAAATTTTTTAKTKMEPPAPPIQSSSKTPPVREDPLSSQLLTQRTALFFEHLYRDVCFGIFPRAYIYPKIGQNWQKQDPSFAALALSMSVLGLLGARMPADDEVAKEAKAAPVAKMTSPKTDRRSLLDSLDIDVPFRPPILPSFSDDNARAFTADQRDQVVSLISYTLSTRSLSEGTASFGQQPGCTSIFTSLLLSLALWCLEEAEANSNSATRPAAGSTWRDASFLRFAESVALAKILGIDKLAIDEATSQDSKLVADRSTATPHGIDIEERERRIRTWALLVRCERWWASQRDDYRPQLRVPRPLADARSPPASKSTPLKASPVQPPPLLSAEPKESMPSPSVWQSRVSRPLLQPTPQRFTAPGSAGASIMEWIRSSATISEMTPRAGSLQLPPPDEDEEEEEAVPAPEDEAMCAPTQGPDQGQGSMRDQLAVLIDLGFAPFHRILTSRFSWREIECWQGRCAAETCQRLDSALALRIDDSLLDLSMHATSLSLHGGDEAGEATSTRPAALNHRDGILLELIRQVFRCRLWRASLRHGLIVSSPATAAVATTSMSSRSAAATTAKSPCFFGTALTAATVPPPLRPDQPLHIGLDTLDILEDLHDVVFVSANHGSGASSCQPLVRGFLHEIADCVRAVAQSRYRDDAFVLEEEEGDGDDDGDDAEEGQDGADGPGRAEALQAGKDGGQGSRNEIGEEESTGKAESVPPTLAQGHDLTKTTIQQGSRAILFDLERFFQQVF
ncbi:uncharacterized protein PFL1_00194 [Pseudozyma flocculosa PF-1]|uniref:Transcription factor domain-containing protein n=1 Tax=Pseudozyma flocculosa TaxID=84751 RepID=A0A5C3EVG3_9BASI|nr:uncharacterized protein PFL1_00194 [Pseudozyma flocculosa PF-1]EPQ31996.1 hypothetical protein PFL1_00194 [Pseudozyma flocculosa PF-1]SPO35081.1 uncharacterized protein PSFLO_00552 [Pseudozyma flocculosa]